MSTSTSAGRLARLVLTTFLLSCSSQRAEAPDAGRRDQTGGAGGDDRGFAGKAGAGAAGAARAAGAGSGGDAVVGTGGGAGAAGQAGAAGMAGAGPGAGGAAPAGPDAWTQQGGPNGDAVLPAGFDPTWPGGKPAVAWQAAVGFGSAPVVVGGGLVYTFGLYKPGTKQADLTSAAAMPTNMEVRPGTFDTLTIPGTGAGEESHMAYRGDEWALALDEATGALRWATLLTDYGVAYTNHIAWVQASPLLANGKIYFHSEHGTLHALDARDGHALWQANLFDFQMYQWTQKHGNAASPLLVAGNLVVSYYGQSGKDSVPIVAGFDPDTGKNRWITTVPLKCFRCMNSHLGVATIEGKQTLLVPAGAGTAGIDAATGALLWSYAARGNLPAAEGANPTPNAFPYSTYAPAAWKNYVCDGASNAHDDIDSRTWCLQITGGTAKLAWASNELVQHGEIDKGNMLIRDGVLYVFDSRGGWATTATEPKRGFRPAGLGRFQARDVATGKLLFSSDALSAFPTPMGYDEWYPTKSLLAGDVLVAIDRQAIWFGKLSATGLTLATKIANPTAITCAPAATNQGCLATAEPVLANGRLYVRQMHVRDDYGYNRALGATGNLWALQVAPR